MRFIIALFTAILVSVGVRAQFNMPPYQPVQYVHNGQVVTKSISGNTGNTASSGGVIGVALSSVTTRGVCWGTSINPIIGDSKTLNGAGARSFTSSLTGLSVNTVYYVRAYATNSNGKTVYGQNEIFRTVTGPGYLNCATYSAPNITFNNSADFDNLVNSTPVYDSKILLGSVVIDFSDKSKLSNAGITFPNNGDNFAVISSGYFTPSQTGIYTFTCEGDDAVDLFVNGVNVVNQYGANSEGAMGTHTGTINLTANVRYTFRARMKENYVGEALRVYWKKPSGGAAWIQDANEISPVLPTDGNLNYKVYSSALGSPANQTEFDNYLRVASVYGQGTAAAATLINFTVYNQLTVIGIALPNNYNGFGLDVSGYFIPSESGIYTFTCEGDDAVDLFINDVNIAAHYGGHAPSAVGTHQGTINLTAGVKYSFKARQQEDGGSEALRVFWKKPSGSVFIQDFKEISSN